MTELLEQPEHTEEELRDEAIAESLAELRPEEPEVEDASSDATPGDEAPETTPEQEPSPEPEPELGEGSPFKTVEERDEWAARAMAKELREHPELGDALVAIKQGRAKLIDASVLEAAQEFMSKQAVPDIQAEPDDFEEKFWSDPIAVLREIKGKTESFETWQAQQSELRAQAEFRDNTNLLTTVGEEWQSTHPELTEDQVANVVAAVQETGLIARAFNRHGDKTRAVREGLEAGLRIEYPELIQQARQNEAIREANRKRRAGATAASPRSVPRRTEEPTPPRTSAARVEFLADAIRDLDAAQQ